MRPLHYCRNRNRLLVRRAVVRRPSAEQLEAVEGRGAGAAGDALAGRHLKTACVAALLLVRIRSGVGGAVRGTLLLLLLISIVGVVGRL